MTLVQRLRSPWVVMPVVAALALAAWYAFVRDDGSTGTPSARTQVVQATTGTIAKTVTADGTVAAADTEDLTFSSAGTVTKVNVKAGDTVKAGQVLAEIDSAELESSLASAEASLADAQAKLSDDEDAGASDAQIEADTSSVQSAQDQVDQAQEALDGAKLTASIDGTVAEVNISVGEQLASGGAGGTSQTGSASGSGASASTLGSGGSSSPGGGGGGSSSGSGSSSTSADISLVTAGRYTVALGIDSSDISKVKVGQTATVSLSTASSSTNGFGGFPGGFGGLGFPGQAQSQGQSQGQGGASTTTTTAPSTSGDGATALVTEVGTVADASSGVSTYPVTVSFRDSSGTYNVGASVTVAITYQQVADAVQVPIVAVASNGGQSSVTVQKAGGGTEVRSVQTGLTSGTMVQITSGLEAGESVVISLPGAPAGSGTNRTGDGGSGGSGGTITGYGPGGGGVPPQGFQPATGGGAGS